jgi:hypothetical protein
MTQGWGNSVHTRTGLVYTENRSVLVVCALCKSESKFVEIISSLHPLFFLYPFSTVACKITDGNHLVKRFFPFPLIFGVL